ncbi:NUDIX hydrolase [Cryptosporangium sp. NPDC048952]|uniref:NUDIX hydrolase n=1 Tax=Cryptosporangium sp. NPDC048952 TaxID=3363961 RepID=UPI003715F0B2
MVLLRDHDDRLLLVRQPPAAGWSLPGGLLDRREHPREAAVREVREEIGVELEPDSVTPIVPNAHVNPWVQQVDLIFTATVDAGEIALRVDEVEIGEAQWFALDALPSLTGPTFRLLGRAGLVSPDTTPATPATPATPEPSPAPAAEPPSVGAAPATIVGAVLDGGADRTDAVLAEPGEAFADPEATETTKATEATERADTAAPGSASGAGRDENA